MSNNLNSINGRKRFTRQAIISNTFYQMPRFLTAGEFAGNKLSNNARVLYTLLLDRHRLSVKSGWFDENGEVYVYFKREEMQAHLGLSERTIVKIMQELKDFSLVEEKQQGLSKPNKIYVLSPVIGDDENPTPYLDPETDYNPDKEHSESYDDCFNDDCVTGYGGITPLPVSEELRVRTLKNYDSLSEKIAVSGSVNFVSADPQKLSPINNKLINNKKSNNYMSNNEISKTASTAVSFADAKPPAAEAVGQAHTSLPIPYSQILEMYNEFCETKGLRPIRSINGKRKSQTAARFKEYGLGGFVELLEKVSASIFLCGGGERGWKADYDWLIDPTNMQKVLEGKYDNEQSNVPLVQSQIYETYPTARFSNPPQNKQERRDPFLDRAMIAYAKAAQAAAI